MPNYRFRYELAEVILRNNGTNEEIQRRIMKEFPDSRVNPSRAQWYRRSFNKYGHCRGPLNKEGKRVISTKFKDVVI